MTISSTNRKAGPYAGNGVTVAFPFAFKVFETGDVVVVATNAAGAETTLALGTNYSVALNSNQDSNPGGTVTMVVAPASGEKLTLTSGLDELQPVTLTNNGGFYPRVINDALDRAVILIQQVAEKVSRSLVFPISSSVGVALPSPAANNVIGWNSTADGFQNYAPVDNTLLSASLGSTLTGQGAALIGGFIADSVTLNVPAQYATIQAALDYLATQTIVRGATVTIQVADGTYTLTSVNYVDHPQGEQIQIIGDTTTPSNCILNFSTSDGFYVPKGRALGKLDGFRIVNTTVKSAATPYLGILTDGGKYVSVGPKIEVHNFYYGIAARSGGHIHCEGNVTDYVKVTNAGDVGIWAFLNSYISCQYADVSYCDDSVNSLGGGIVAEFDSAIQANYAKCHHNWLCGMAALSSSAIRAFHSVVNNNQFAYKTFSNGSIEIFYSTVTNSSVYGYQSLSGGKVLGWATCTQSGNNTYNGFAFRDDVEQDESGYYTKFNCGSVTIAGDGPQAASGGDSYLDMRATTGHYTITRFIVNGVERGRSQYGDSNDVYELIINSRTLLRAFDHGKVTVGRHDISTASTAGHFQIPKVSGQPTGAVSDVETGFVPLVYDTTNNKLWVYNGAWKGVVLA